MKLKILLTGANKKIISDLSERIETDRGHTTLRCAVSKAAIYDVMISELPHVVVICLGDENWEAMRVYDILKESSRLGALDIIVVGNDEDRKGFLNNTQLEKLAFVQRPVPIAIFYRKLAEIEKKHEDGVSYGAAIEEYYNPHANDPHPKKHIIVVDDDSEQLVMIKEHLEEFYDVTMVKSGMQLFKYLEKHMADLILLDYLMPEMDGPEVLKSLRSHDIYKTIPVIFLTGVSEKETVVKTLVELMPQGYVLKPTRKSELVAKIIDVLG